MNKVIIFTIMTCLSFSQFEAGKKAVGGQVSTFKSDVTTWKYDGDEIKFTDTAIGLNNTGAYFVIDNLSILFGVQYVLYNQTWECNGSDCSDDWFTGFNDINYAIELENPFGYMLGSAYYFGNSYAHASYVDPSSINDDDSYMSFGGGYMLEMAPGIYLDTKVEYRHSLSETSIVSVSAPPTGTPIGDILNASDVESSSLQLYGSMGVTVVF